MDALEQMKRDTHAMCLVVSSRHGEGGFHSQVLDEMYLTVHTVHYTTIGTSHGRNEPGLTPDWYR
jgi:hypothetical protein